MSQYTTMAVRCPACRGKVEIETEDTPGEISGNAGLVLNCDHCGKPFAVRVAGNIKMSHVTAGAVELERYYEDVEDSKERILAKYGLGRSGHDRV